MAKTTKIAKADSILIDKSLQGILDGVISIIERSRRNVAVYVNQEMTMMYWHVGQFILQEINYQDKSEYGQKIVATLSQQLSWSHFVEFITIEQDAKRLFYRRHHLHDCHEDHRNVRCVEERHLLATRGDLRVASFVSARLSPARFPFTQSHFSAATLCRLLLRNSHTKLYLRSDISKKVLISLRSNDYFGIYRNKTSKIFGVDLLKSSECNYAKRPSGFTPNFRAILRQITD